MDIMNMKSGTKIVNKRSNLTYVLGDYVNEVAREIIMCGGFLGSVDYINKNTQDQYEVVE